MTTPGYKFAFGFNAPLDLFERELYYDEGRKLPYYRVYGFVKPGNNRYYFTSTKDGKDYMVVRSKAKFPIVSCQVCGKAPTAVCGACNEVGYCGEACQTTDWSSHIHECVAK